MCPPPTASTYAGHEDRDGVATQDYRLDGPWLDARGDTLWGNAEGGHFQVVGLAATARVAFQRAQLGAAEPFSMTSR